MASAPPKHTIKAGNVQAAIWEKSGKGRNGQSFTTQSVSFSASYQDKDGKWQNRTSFKFNELPYILDLYWELRKWKQQNGQSNTPPQSTTSNSPQADF